MNVDSVKARLKKQSIVSGKTMQELLITYGLERTIYRISVSEYRDRFTLKGGIFLYAIFNGKFPRATTDIDLLADHTSNDTETLKEVFSEILSCPSDDPLFYDLGTLEVIPTTECKEYHGVNVSVTAYLDKTRIKVSIDIGFGDIVYPDRVMMDFPIVLSETAPRVYAYSVYSCIAEKFEAIVSLGYDNSRFKDFYDIYVLANEYDFDGTLLKEAIKETFEYRHTELDDIVAFEDDFSKDTIRQTRWKSFIKKKKAMVNVSLEDSITVLKRLMKPIIDSLHNSVDYLLFWDHASYQWK